MNDVNNKLCPLMIDNTKQDGLTVWSISAQSVGHILNDITSAYISIQYAFFLTVIVKMEPVYVGFVFLSGQIIDAFVTPLFGQISDITNTRIGKRMPIQIFGVIQVFFGIIFIFDGFGKCILCDYNEISPLKITNDQRIILQQQLFLNHITFFGLYNIGFSAVQTAHLSLIPTSSANDKVKDYLITLRTTFIFIAGGLSMVISGVCIFLVNEIQDALVVNVWIQALVGLICSCQFVVVQDEVYLTSVVDEYQANQLENRSQNQSQMDLNKNNSNHVNDNDKQQRKYSQQSCLSRNLSFQSDQFSEKKQTNGKKVSYSDHVIYKMDPIIDVYATNTLSTSLKHFTSKQIKSLSWLRQLMFYSQLATYCSARVAQTQIPDVINLQITKSVGIIESQHITTIPLIFMVSSIIGSIISAKLINNYSRLTLTNFCNFILLLCQLSFLSIVNLTPSQQLIKMILIQIFQIIVGFITSVYLSVATCLITDLIGEQGSSGAFVWASQSLMDKLSNGFTSFMFFQSIDVHDRGSVALNGWCIPIVFCVISQVTMQIECKKPIFGNDDWQFNQ